MNLISCLLSDPTVVRLETWGAEPAPPTITLTLTSRARPAPCPLCGRRAKRTHSWYERALADLPWGEHAVAVQLRVRKLFCDNDKCKRRIFTERLPGVAAPWARKTARLSDRLTAVGLALGGAAGARLGHSIGLPLCVLPSLMGSASRRSSGFSSPAPSQRHPPAVGAGGRQAATPGDATLPLCGPTIPGRMLATFDQAPCRQKAASRCCKPGTAPLCGQWPCSPWHRAAQSVLRRRRASAPRAARPKPSIAAEVGSGTAVETGVAMKP